MANGGGTLRGIAERRRSRGVMQELPHTTISTARGVGDDLRGKPGRRQVTVLAAEGWQRACADAGVELPWVTRRANLLVSGIDLADRAGSVLEIGAVRLQITGETAPCQRMEEASAGLQAALAGEWRGGVTCRVLRGGEIRVGDPVHLTESAAPAGEAVAAAGRTRG